MSHNCGVVPGRGWRLAFAAARAWLGLLTVLVALAWSGAAFAAPVITSISPDSRLLSEETASIYIYGTGFTGAWDNTDVSVSVGGQPAGFAYVTNASEMGAFFSAPATTGAVDITVTTPDGISNAVQFTWLPDPPPPSSDAALSGLTISAGTFQSAFNPGELGGAANGAGCNVTYQVDVPYSVDGISVTPTANDSGASIKVNGTPVDSGSASGTTSLGEAANINVAKIVVTAEDGTTKTYCLTVNRAPAPETAPFSGLSISPGQLDQDFDTTRSNYTATLPHAHSSATISWTTGYSNPTIEVYYTVGSDLGVQAGTVNGLSTSIPLAAGKVTKVTIRSAQSVGSAYEIYQVNVTRAASLPTVSSVSPAAGPAAGGTGVTITGTGFTGLTSLAFGGAEVPGAVVVSDTQISATAPAGTHGAVDVEVTTPGGTATLSGGYAYVTPPVAAGVSKTVAANSSDNVIDLGLSGDEATSVTVVAEPETGTATVSGTSVTYTPTPGYSGSDSFTYTATNAGGTSTVATVSINVTAPTLILTPSAGALPDGQVGTAYSQTIGASAGGGDYGYELTSGPLPEGLDLDGTTGIIAGTPSEAGDFDLTISVTDAYEGAGNAAYTLHVAPAKPVAVALTVRVAANSSNNGIAPDLSGGAADSFAIVDAASHGRATASGLSITYTPAQDYSGPDSFTYTATNSAGTSAVATVSIIVSPSAVTATDKAQDVPAGADAVNIDLTAGATGGPFTSAAIVSVTPPGAGTATIVGSLVAGPAPVQPGFYLKFVRNPGLSGSVVVDYTLTSALGISNIGSVTYNFAIDVTEAATLVDGLVQDFIAERQSLLSSSIKLPGLLDRRAPSTARVPVSATLAPYGGDGMALSFGTSLAQLQASSAAADAAAGLPTMVEQPRLNIWASGTAGIHTGSGDGESESWGDFALLSTGVDYLLNDGALVGLSFHLDHLTDPTDADAQLTGNGWLVGPYGAFEIARGIFLDSNLLYGRTANSIDTGALSGVFGTSRWMSDTSLYGQWQLDAATTVTPKLRVVYLNETVADYEVANNVGTVVEMPGFTDQQLRLSLGAELTHEFVLGDGLRVIPTVGVIAGLSALDDAAAYGSMTTNLRLTSWQSWTIDAGLLLNFDAMDRQSIAGKFGIAGQF